MFVYIVAECAMRTQTVARARACVCLLWHTSIPAIKMTSYNPSSYNRDYTFIADECTIAGEWNGNPRKPKRNKKKSKSNQAKPKGAERTKDKGKKSHTSHWIVHTCSAYAHHQHMHLHININTKWKRARITLNRILFQFFVRSSISKLHFSDMCHELLL